jgi:YD repeat-containing protein
VVITNAYDSLNRLITSQANAVNGIPAFNYANLYDVNTWTWYASYGVNGKGRLVGTTNNIDNDAAYSYDAMGRMIAQGNRTPSTLSSSPLVTTSSYDLTGHLTSLTYPDGRAVTQGFLADGRLHSVTFADWDATPVGYSYLSSASYFPDGSPASMTFGNGITQSYSKNSRLQPVEITLANGATTYFDKQYCYGPTNDPAAPFCKVSGGANNGNILQILDAKNSANSQGFSYDSLNRLTAFSNTSQSMQQTYTLDSFGNMSQSGGGATVLTFSASTNRVSNLPCASSLRRLLPIATCRTAAGSRSLPRPAYGLSMSIVEASRLPRRTPTAHGRTTSTPTDRRSPRRTASIRAYTRTAALGQLPQELHGTSLAPLIPSRRTTG